MGMRSQIYIRYNGKLIVANYYQWNYGDRMISRARYTLDWIEMRMDNPWIFHDDSYIETLRRICDVNFDYKDIVRSINIIEEFAQMRAENTWAPGDDFKDIVFLEQANNDGQLYIDIVSSEKGYANDTDKKDYQIKYCFVHTDFDKPLNCNQYMNIDTDVKDWTKATQYFSQEFIDVCKENIEAIEKIATLMTKDELKEFINKDYEFTDNYQHAKKPQRTNAI